MQIIPLTIEESANTGFQQKLVLTYADLAVLTSGTGASIYPGFNETNTFGAAHRVTAAWAKVVTPFAYSGANNGTLVFTLGDSGSATRLMANTDLKGTVTYQEGAIANLPYTYTAAGQILITATAATQALTALTAGELHIYLGIAPMNLLDR